MRSFEYICRSYGVNYRHQFTVYIITFTKAKKIKLPPKSATDKKLSKQTSETWNLYCSVYWSEVICSIMAKHKMAKSFHLKMWFFFAFWNENIITFLSKLMPDPSVNNFGYRWQTKEKRLFKWQQITHFIWSFFSHLQMTFFLLIEEISSVLFCT